MSFDRLQIAAFLDKRAVKMQGQGQRLVATHLQAAAQDIRSKLDLEGPDPIDNEDAVRGLLRIAVENTPYEMQDILPGGGKQTELVRLRHGAIWAAAQRFNLENATLARRLGCDRTGIAYAIERAEYYREREPDFKEFTDSLLLAAPRCPHCHHSL